MNKTSKIILALSIPIVLISSSCSKETNSDSSSSNSRDLLHFSFKTPDSERCVNCELDFPIIALNDSTNVIAFSSASTNASLCFSYPKDSSKIVNNRELKRFKIKSYYDNNEPFQFSQKLPLDQNSLDDSTTKLVSNESFF
jgi:hypothetical protein